jgi:hypothetical protein
MPKDSVGVTASLLCDSSRRFKAKRKGENSHSLIKATARGVAARFNDLDYYVDIFIVLELTLVNPDGSIALAS